MEERLQDFGFNLKMAKIVTHEARARMEYAASTIKVQAFDLLKFVVLTRPRKTPKDWNPSFGSGRSSKTEGQEEIPSKD